MSEQIGNSNDLHLGRNVTHRYNTYKIKCILVLFSFSGSGGISFSFFFVINNNNNHR